MRLLIFIVICVLAHVPKGSKKHDHGQPHAHHHNHDHDHSHSHDAAHSHSHAHEHSQGILGIQTHFESPFKPYLTLINSYANEAGPLASASMSSILTTTASLLIFVFIWFIQKFNILTEDLLSTLTSFASGALLGDVFLHLLHSIPDSTFSSLLILSGILIFFVLDRLLSHNHDHHEKHKQAAVTPSRNKKKPSGASQSEPPHTEEKHQESALLLLLADFLHNTTDGMAIGASYAVNPGLGISTTIAIFLHEIAHEVGDFIAFLKFGISLKKALLLNLTTGLGSLLGCIISIYYGSVDTLTRIVLPIVAGNFLYVSLISMLAPMKLKKKSLVIWEIFFFCLGVGLMVLIEELE